MAPSSSEHPGNFSVNRWTTKARLLIYQMPTLLNEIWNPNPNLKCPLFSFKGVLEKKNNESQIGTKCYLFDGSWIYDDTYPLYDTSSCPFIDREFDCQKNGCPDSQYLKCRWKPKACALPRFNGQDFLRKLKGKKILFVGDSLSYNQWQSLTCMLHSAVPKAKYTSSSKGDFYTLLLPEYEVSVMFSRNKFLVDLVQTKEGMVLNLDSIEGGHGSQLY